MKILGKKPCFWETQSLVKKTILYRGEKLKKDKVWTKKINCQVNDIDTMSQDLEKEDICV